MTPGRQGLLVLLGLWVGLGIVLAPSRPMPGMAEVHTQEVHAQEEAEGHHSPHAPNKNKGNEPHALKCVLCLVGAGALPVVIGVVPVSSPSLQVKGLALPHPSPRRFSHFRSRAPPVAG